MSNFVTKILVPTLFAYGLSTFALSAQTMNFRFAFDPSEQTVFWKNIQDFKPHPVENQGDTATFQISSAVSRDSFCFRLLAHFRQRSFLLVSIDSIQSPITSSPITNHQSLTIGPSMRWVSLRAGSGFKNENWLSSAGFREKKFTGKPVRHEAVLKLEQSVLEQAENNGYPFAAVWLDSVVVDSGGAVS
ncbi:MAG: hypothetical protein H7246_11010, partial [Phycisphaerae bacterium]|nr:hypothetical protein [Saprospiraceae bacterium]